VKAWQSEAERRRQYDAYMASPAWRRKRQMVLDRDGGICQGCRKHAASEVHHMTYVRFGCEMLFDLVSVCEDCHDKIHGRTHDR
jgi:5-methylcytosine-specific restriction endonuclease McrA